MTAGSIIGPDTSTAEEFDMAMTKRLRPQFPLRRSLFNYTNTMGESPQARMRILDPMRSISI